MKVRFLKSCAFTGHRPERFFFKFNELHPLCVKIKSSLLEQAKILYDRGVRRFYVGGAQGADMWAGETVIELKKSLEHPGIEFICVIPFKGYEREWNDESRERLERLLSSCDEVKVISTPGDRNAIKKRNYFLVENSDYLVAIYTDNKMRSGTRQTVDYAMKKKREIVFIHPETAVVSHSIT
jgi:uncharacterized phage-like protein YoqJ